MSGKKNSKAATTGGNVPALKIGSQVRCTDDDVLGKITWANATSVKIKWDDGEMVTWRRDELAGKPIEILAADDEPRDGQPALEAETGVAEAPPEPEQAAPTEIALAAPEATPTGDAAETPVPDWQAALEAARPSPADELAAATPAAATPPATEQPQGQVAVSTTDVVVDAAKPKRQRKAPAEPKEKKVSALDAAARVLVEAGQMLTCKEMIAAMAIKGYWSSPGGQTPDATLCSAILREIKVKGEQSRFVKAAPGRFTARPTA